jgi:hypothetical protein
MTRVIKDFKKQGWIVAQLVMEQELCIAQNTCYLSVQTSFNISALADLLYLLLQFDMHELLCCCPHACYLLLLLCSPTCMSCTHWTGPTQATCQQLGPVGKEISTAHHHSTVR